MPVYPRWQTQHAEQKRLLLHMDFTTFRNALLNIPAQIVGKRGKIVYRLLAWNPWQGVFFRLFARVKTLDHR